MTRKAKRERNLPALPESAGTFTDTEDGTLGVELNGWLTAMSQLAAQGDDQPSQALIEACQPVPRLWEILSPSPRWPSPPGSTSSPRPDPEPRLPAAPSRRRS